MTSFVMGLVMLLLKGSLMGSVKGKDAEENEAEIEMSNDIVYTDNPLQNVSDSKDATTNVETHSRVYELEMENADLKAENTDLKTENAKKTQENTGLNTEITDVKTENTILKQKINELKSKSNDNNDNSNADL
jgi:hypothetical protein